MSHDPNSASGDLSSAEFLAAVDRSGLLTGVQLERFQTKVRGGPSTCTSTELADALVREGFLTEFQARRLLKGKGNGLVIGRYAVLDRVGSGAMGRVFKARHQLLDRVVALKLISPEYAVATHAASRFLREMKLVGLLDHVNIVRAFDADLFHGIPFIVMEFVEGEDLKQMHSRRGPLPPAEVADYLSQAARGLAHAHRKGVIHRDIKPSNLLVDASGVVKVLDLGLGDFLEDFGDQSHMWDTGDGMAVGTLDYMSPEQAVGGPLDPRTDLFSLGCTMYRTLTGAWAFPGTSRMERLARRISEPHAPITRHRPDLPRDVVAVVDRLLAPRPSDRYATADEAADALESLLPAGRRPAGARRKAPAGHAESRHEPDLPRLDWKRIEQGLSTDELPSRPRSRADRRRAADDAEAREHLRGHRRSLEADGAESGRAVQSSYHRELSRLNRAEGTPDEIDAPLVDRWLDRLGERLGDFLSDPSPTQILLVILALILALALALAMVAA